MFDIHPDTLGNKTDKLLYNIWKTLERMNVTPELTIEPPAEPVVLSVKTFPCKYCGKQHDRSQLTICAKKHKKVSKEVGHV